MMNMNMMMKGMGKSKMAHMDVWMYGCKDMYCNVVIWAKSRDGDFGTLHPYVNVKGKGVFRRYICRQLSQ